MKATVSRKQFQDALAIAASASSLRSTMPTLLSIKMEMKDDGLVLTGCDGEMWAQATLPANVEEGGTVCVQQRSLSEVVGALPDENVSLHMNGSNLVLTSGHSEWKLFAGSSDSFPTVPEVPQVSELKLPMGELRKAIESVSYAVADDRARMNLTGVRFLYDGGTLTLVATDTHRMAITRLHREGVGSEISVTVPEKALKTIRSLPIADDEGITFRFDDSRLTVDVGTAVVVSQLLEGPYPNWERVVPTEFTRKWMVDRKELLDNLKRAQIMARDNSNRVRLEGEEDKIVITANSEARGDAREEVGMTGNNPNMAIAFNVKYLIDALSAMPGDGVNAELTESARPAVLRPTDSEYDHFCIVMPMALN